MATQIVDALTTDWKPDRYEDSYREQVLELIRKKSKGQEIVVPEPEEEEEAWALARSKYQSARWTQRPVPAIA